MDVTFKYFKNISDLSQIQDSLDIRYKVFIDEQNVDQNIERDEYENTATHIIMYINTTPIATSRIITTEEKIKIGRVAVLKEYRGKGLGEIIMKETLNHLIKGGTVKVYISAQLYINKFYEKLGFIPISDVYLEANIEHITMVCELKDKELYKLSS
jgi:predicted GNAT family N-acyltransferase